MAKIDRAKNFSFKAHWLGALAIAAVSFAVMPSPSQAASPKSPAEQTQQVQKASVNDVSARRRHYRRHVRVYRYGPRYRYYRRPYYDGRPYYYYRPYYYAPAPFPFFPFAAPFYW